MAFQRTLATCGCLRTAHLALAGRHYQVHVADGDDHSGNSSCNCPDARIRKRTCKHQRLILKTLGIEDNASRWRDASRTLIETHAAGRGAPEPPVVADADGDGDGEVGDGAGDGQSSDRANDEADGAGDGAREGGPDGAKRRSQSADSKAEEPTGKKSKARERKRARTASRRSHR